MPRQKKKKDDTWIDSCLDFLREHRMPPLLEAGVAWLVVSGCLFYYGCSYAVSSLQLCLGQKPHLAVPLVTSVKTEEDSEPTAVQEELYEQIQSQLAAVSAGTATELIAAIRTNLPLRKLVSQFMMTTQITTKTTTTTTTRSAPSASNKYPQLYQKLSDIWMDLLRLPSPMDNEQQGDDQHTSSSPYAFDLSLILPAFREAGSDVAATLNQALETCKDPHSVQVVVVDAGQCPGLVDALVGARASGRWGQLDVVKYEGNGGRGPCLNHGAASARGRYYTFLHSDTVLPLHWDERIKATLLACNDTNENGTRRAQKHQRVVTHACAFAFGHDTSPHGLRDMRYPWGIGSVRFLGNLRASLFKLPYGDHVISIPAAYFHYIGGYPEQQIMEDYVLMDLLRKRAVVLPERLGIVPGRGAKCSVRRWQKLGTVYVQLTNLLVVYRYLNCGWTANDIYDYYYLRPFRTKKRV